MRGYDLATGNSQWFSEKSPCNSVKGRFCYTESHRREGTELKKLLTTEE